MLLGFTYYLPGLTFLRGISDILSLFTRCMLWHH